MELWNTMKSLVNCTMMLPLIPLCFYSVQDYVKEKFSALVTKIILLLFGLTLGLAMIECMIFPVVPRTNMVTGCCGVLFFCCYSKEVRLPFCKKLFVFLTACLVGSFSLLFATIADYNLYPEGNYLDFSMEALAVQILFLLAADVVLYKPLAEYLGWIIDHFHEKAVWRGMCIILLLFMLVLYTMVPYQYSRMKIGKIKHIYVVVLFFLVFLVLVIYYMFYIITFTYVQKKDTEYMNHFLSIQGAQYQQLLRAVEESSRTRHDFRQQLIVISELVNQKEYDRLEQYVHKYIENVQTEVKLYSYSAAVNSVISYYKSVCDRKNIRTDFSVSLSHTLAVSDQDFCIMLGNLLENAIEGTKDTAEPYIRLKLRQTASNILAMKVENPCHGTLKMQDGRFLSNKREGLGQGLESVRVIAEKYQGIVEILTDQNIFTVKVLLQIPSEEYDGKDLPQKITVPHGGHDK